MCWPVGSRPRGAHGPRLGPAVDGDYDHLGVTSSSQDPVPCPGRCAGYLTLCSACSGYADFRQPLHAKQRINIHPSYSLSIHQRRRRWQGHDACCAVDYRQQKSYSFQPPFPSKRPFHHLDQKLEHLRHW